MEIIDFDDNERIKDIDKEYAYGINTATRQLKIMEEKKREEELNAPITFKGVMKELFSLLVYLFFTFVIVYTIITYVGQRTVVSGDSMADTLANGDNIIVDKISYRFKNPERFDVIIFPPRYEHESLYIKRIIGLPGEDVFIDADGSIYINQKKLDEHYGLETITVFGRATQTIHLADDEYFVMGDNRNNSLDSRFDAVGNIKRDEIAGRAWLRFYPFSSWGFVSNIK